MRTPNYRYLSYYATACVVMRIISSSGSELRTLRNTVGLNEFVLFMSHDIRIGLLFSQLGTDRYRPSYLCDRDVSLTLIYTVSGSIKSKCQVLVTHSCVEFSQFLRRYRVRCNEIPNTPQTRRYISLPCKVWNKSAMYNSIFTITVHCFVNFNIHDEFKMCICNISSFLLTQCLLCSDSIVTKVQLSLG